MVVILSKQKNLSLVVNLMQTLSTSDIAFLDILRGLESKLTKIQFVPIWEEMEGL